jgi:hypothetical protein
MARGGHGLPKVSLGPAMPYLSTPPVGQVTFYPLDTPRRTSLLTLAPSGRRRRARGVSPPRGRQRRRRPNLGRSSCRCGARRRTLTAAPTATPPRGVRPRPLGSEAGRFRRNLCGNSMVSPKLSTGSHTLPGESDSQELATVALESKLTMDSCSY